MIHYVPYESPPDDFHVPDSLQDRFWYDEEKKCLAFDGVMYKLTFDKIQALHTCYDYQRVVEDLFRLAVPEEDQPSQGGHLLAIASGVVLAGALFAACIFAWRHIQTDDMPPSSQPAITNDLVGN